MFGVVSCAPKQKKASKPMKKQQSSGGGFSSDLSGPNWYFSPPKKDGSLFAAAMATSSRASIALNKAKLKAKRELAGSIQSTLEGQRERYVEEMGNTANSETETKVREQYQDLIREMVSQQLKGVRLNRKAFKEEGRTWRAYALMELTMDDIKQKLSNKEELKTRFNAQQFEKDMEENLQKMRQRRQ
jgi:hypothetical protein